MTRFERGHRHVLTRQLALASRSRRGGENAGERVLAPEVLGTLGG
jgi:hypothetical protein